MLHTNIWIIANSVASKQARKRAHREEINLKIGIIGSGSIIEVFMQAAFKVKGVEILAVYSRNKESERMEELKSKYQLPFVYDDLKEMLANPKVDCIYVASPNSLHFAHSLMALEADKHVICEKPFTTTGAEARKLLATAKEKDLMLFEGITTIHMPNYKLVKELLPTLGDVHIAQLNFSQYSNRYDKLLLGEKPNVFNPAFSGGCLQDLNIYNVHFMYGLFGKPDFAQYFPNFHSVGVDTSGILILQYPNFNASLVSSKDTVGENFVYLQGEKGYIFLSSSGSVCRHVEVHIKGEEKIIYNEQKEENWLYYELKEMKKLFQEKDYATCYQWAEYSVSVISLVEETRKKAGIIFPADED